MMAKVYGGLVCSTTRQKQNIVCVRGNVSLLFGLFCHFDVIFMVARKH
jgi:hypothetical protein